MRRVLIVDDSPTLRRILSAMLEAQGWSVDRAEDAERGATVALTSPPDVVVSDLWMPGLSGLQLCQLLRGDPATAHVPVVLLTSGGDRRSRFWARRSGASAFLDKSNLTEVAQVIDRLVPGRDEEPVALTLDLGIRPSSIPGRLSQLLDRALFDAVVAGELRALAFEASDVETLFLGLIRLLTDIMEYRWLALAVQERERYRAYVHQDASAGAEALPETIDALGLPPEAISATHTVADDRTSSVVGRGATLVTHPVVLMGKELGTLAVLLPVRNPSREESQVLNLAAREIALPLHAVALLEETRRLAATDALTGLANRRQGSEALAREVARAERYSHNLSIGLVDVDHFKRVNDTFGHVVGDRVLCHVANILRTASRVSDQIIRWGGEEFLVILSGTSRVGARMAIERLRTAVACTPYVTESGTSIELTVSVGLARCSGQGVDRLLDDADRALYRAKDHGRNRVESAEDGDG